MSPFILTLTLAASALLFSFGMVTMMRLKLRRASASIRTGISQRKGS